MPSPETDDPAALIAPPAPRPARPPRRWLWAVAGLAVAIPLLVTLAGALTSPPHVPGPPVGHLIYLDADQPSEHTTDLRGLRVLAPDGSSRLLLHEAEAQDTDTGQREWITQPQASPDGKWLAYERQDMTILEERKEIVNQLWVLPLNAPHPQPKMLLDLTKAKLKQFVGLAWSDDDEAVTFLNDGTAYEVDAMGAPGLFTQRPLTNCPPLKIDPTISATRNPTMPRPGLLAYETITPTGPQIAVTNGANVTHLDYLKPPAPPWALSATGRLATASDNRWHTIHVQDTAYPQRANAQDIPVRWGWSAFGGRRITSLKWSPDGRYIGYTVSKPPLEDELFYVDTQTKKCYQLPVRTGQGGWDWAP